MEKYLNGRIKAYDRLFTEISPPIPQELSLIHIYLVKEMDGIFPVLGAVNDDVKIVATFGNDGDKLPVSYTHLVHARTKKEQGRGAGNRQPRPCSLWAIPRRSR